MKKMLLKPILLCVLMCSAFLVNSYAQGTYGATSYFNLTYSKVDWTGFAGTFKTVVDGDSLFFLNSNSTGPTRAKGGYTGAVRVQAIELPLFPSLGYLSVYIQNGSSGTNRNIYFKIWDDATSAWVTVATYLVGGNQDLRISPPAVLSKKPVKVKIDTDGANIWFHQVEAWSSTLATSDVNAAPKILSINPTPGSVLTNSDSITIQFDEIVKLGSGTASFSGSTVTPTFLGSSLKLKYSNLLNATNVLMIPSAFIKNKSDISLAKDTSFTYLNDATKPVFQSASPVNGSKIHVNDIVGKITLTFDENISIGSGTISFGPAIITPVVSGKTLIIGYAGLAYSTAYKLIVPANFIKDKSGNLYDSEISIDYITNDRDNTIPVLISQSVNNGAIDVPIGGSIGFTFNEIVKPNGNVTINGVSMPLSANGTVAGVNYLNLDYNSSYTLTIPAGAITDTTGNPYPGSTFTFSTKAFAAQEINYFVAKDGSGTHTTVQSAIDAVSNNSPQRTLIFIKNGIYYEKITIPATKQNVSLIGQDSAKTIITYDDYAGKPGLSTDLSFTIDIKAKGFYAENLTIKNTWSTTGGSTNQAVALMTEGDKQVFKNCRAFSFQDTHYPKTENTRNYYLNCFIQGATDFMFGSGTSFFESSVINCVSGGQYITAPSGTTKEFGLVYNNCIITANSNVSAQVYFLGRPWKDNAKTVWLNTKMGPHVRDIGWSVWATAGDDADNHLTGFYAEYNSMNLAGTVINPIRAAWGKKLSPAEASRYTIDNVFNYGTGSDTWNPLPYSTAPEAPAGLNKSGNTLLWMGSKFAVGYLIFRNDTVIGSTTATTFFDNKSGTNSYRIKAFNEFGAQSNDSFVLGLVNSNEELNGTFYPNPFADFISFKDYEKLSNISFYNEEGIMVKQVPSSEIVKTQDLDSGYYLIKALTKDGNSHHFKMIKQ